MPHSLVINFTRTSDIPVGYTFGCVGAINYKILVDVR